MEQDPSLIAGNHVPEQTVLTLGVDGVWLSSLYGFELTDESDVDAINRAFEQKAPPELEELDEDAKRHLLITIGIFDIDSPKREAAIIRLSTGGLPDPRDVVVSMRLLSGVGIDTKFAIDKQPLVVTRPSSQLEEALEKVSEEVGKTGKSFSELVAANPAILISQEVTNSHRDKVPKRERAVGTSAVQAATKEIELTPEAEAYLTRPDIQDQVVRLKSLGIDPRKMLKYNHQNPYLPSLEKIDAVLAVFDGSGLDRILAIKCLINSGTTSIRTIAYSLASIHKACENSGINFVAFANHLHGTDFNKRHKNLDVLFREWIDGLIAAGFSMSRAVQLFENGIFPINGSAAARKFDLGVMGLARDANTDTDIRIRTYVRYNAKAAILAALPELLARPEGFSLQDVNNAVNQLSKRGYTTEDLEREIASRADMYASNPQTARFYELYKQIIQNKYTTRHFGKPKPGSLPEYVLFEAS